MQANYALWLNGNSLVWVHAAVSQSRVDDLLNIQLAAYLAASKRHPRNLRHDGWHREYLRVQGSFGCTPVTVQARPVSAPQAACFEPWAILRANLLAALAAESHAEAGRCLDMFKASPDPALQQALWAECIRLPDAGGDSHAHVELRLVLPDGSIVSTELRFSTASPPDALWLWQVLEPACDEPPQQLDCRYQTSAKLVDRVSCGLQAAIGTKKAQYRGQVQPPVAQEPVHE